MKPFDIIQQLDGMPNATRRKIIINWLEEHEIEYWMQDYSSGINLIVDLGPESYKVGIGSHYDRVPESPGANDNSSAIAVCLDIIRKYRQEKKKEIGLRLFFFDEEETGLKGSSAYIEQYGVKTIIGLINLELVGIGNKLAIWPVDHGSSGILLKTLEQCANTRGIETRRFDKIITHVADHLSFRRAGLMDAFTITCISDEDIAAASQFYTAMQKGAGPDILIEILSHAPIFKNYHQLDDTYDKIEEGAVSMASAVIWDVINSINYHR